MQSSTLKSRPRQAAATPWRNVLRIHEAAELLPRMSEAELRELGEDIKKRGLQTPIAILVGEDRTERLLDGISRLDAMELVGLPVVVDAELNSEVVATQTVAGNVDPYDYVLSANVHRRHLTGEQKREVIQKLLKAKPEQSNRTIAKQVKADHKTVGTVRENLESRGEIPHTETRTDTKGREQPAKKKQEPRESESERTETQESEKDASVILTRGLHRGLQAAWNKAYELCKSNWPDPSAASKARRDRAMNKLGAAFTELIKLAKPPRPRGRPRKVKAGAK
jgi:hypothetical protein